MTATLIEERIDVNDVVVLVKFNEKYKYYLCDKGDWILNYNHSIRSKSEPVDSDYYRFGYEELNSTNIGEFLMKISELEVEYKDLVEMYALMEANKKRVCENVIRPQFYIDFDKRIFYNFYDDIGFYHLYMPDTEEWTGDISYIWDNIPKSCRYYKEDRQIHARSVGNDIVIVYQAFNHQIANEVIRRGTFGEKFKLDRMTWIKPSFLWMMERSGWATKINQERILEIHIKKDYFRKFVDNSVYTSFSEVDKRNAPEECIMKKR